MSKPIDKLIEAIIHRATLDREFRTKLLDDADAAVQEAFGVQIPEGAKIRFIERGPGADFTHVLPDLRADDEELDDDDLDAAAGGNDDWFDPGE